MPAPTDNGAAPALPAGGNDFWYKVDKTLRHHARRAKLSLRAALWQMSQWPADRPVFIVSCSRSGTQMLYKTLSQSRAIGTLNREIYAIWSRLHAPHHKQWQSHVLTAEDAEPSDRSFITRYFYAHTGQHRFVDKNNQHGLAVPYLHALFPDARFVYIKRNPGDTLNSMIEGWHRPERYATWSTRLPAKVAIDGGRFTRWCHFLPEGWRDYLTAPLEEVNAYQYASIHRAIRNASRTIPASQWHEVFYEDVVRDPVASIRSVFEHCELPFTPDIELHTRNLLDKPYDAFSEIRLDKWRDQRHRERIERVLPSLEELARELGYRL